MGRSADTDFTHYLHARWVDLVGGLEDEGVAPDTARLVVAQVLLASRRSWSRRVEQEQVDVAVWADVRRRAGLPEHPGETVPLGVRHLDPADDPYPWLARAENLRAGRRRRAGVVGLAAAAALALLGAGWVWWADRQPDHPVRREANPLPVVWYAREELHLEDVVVELPGVETFVAYDDGAAARLTSGEVVRVEGDGAVTPMRPTPVALDQQSWPPPYLPPGAGDLILQSVQLPGGGWAHLIDSSRRASGQEPLRQSESGRRALVLCSADLECGAPRTIVETYGAIRLR